MKWIASFLSLLLCFAGAKPDPAPYKATLPPQGYWESGYDYYLEIEGDAIVLRDYAKRVVLSTVCTGMIESEDGPLALIPENDRLAYENTEPYMQLDSLTYADDTFTMQAHYLWNGEALTYTLARAAGDAFSDIVIMDDMLEELNGFWHDDEYDYTLEIMDGHISLYTDGFCGEPWADSDVHATRYRDSDAGTIYIRPKDLTLSDFGGCTFLTLGADGELTTTRIVYDAEETTTLHFKKIVGSGITPQPMPIQTADFPPVCYKPVILLYPENKTEVRVSLAPNGGYTCTYPDYGEGWHVIAQPDGTLTDDSGKEYAYLYWEGVVDTKWDMDGAFCVRGTDTAAFLEEALVSFGLNARERQDFITYWLPQMQGNAYNRIAFQKEAYTDAAPLTVTPAPDTLIRVFMVWQPLTQPLADLPETFALPDGFATPERAGFTVVEWGGSRME